MEAKTSDAEFPPPEFVWKFKELLESLEKGAESIDTIARKVWLAVVCNDMSKVERQKTAIREGACELEDADWEALLINYLGDKAELGRFLAQPSWTVGEALEKVFRAQKETRQTRRDKLAKLLGDLRAEAAAYYEAFRDPEGKPDPEKLDGPHLIERLARRICEKTGIPWPERNSKTQRPAQLAVRRELALFDAPQKPLDLEEPLDLWTCRWLYVARQKQIAKLRAEAAKQKGKKQIAKARSESRRQKGKSRSRKGRKQ